MRIYSFKDYKGWVKEIRNFWSFAHVIPLFRGHALDNYELLPTICRNKAKTPEEIQIFEQVLLSKFKSSLVHSKIGSTLIHLNQKSTKFLDDWFCLYQMRHLELPSRLLDWSLKDIVALYFAVESEKYFGKDGHVWFFPESVMNFSNVSGLAFRDAFERSYEFFSASTLDQEKLDLIDPYKIDKITLLHNYYDLIRFEDQIAEKRKLLQAGKFTLNPSNLILTPIDQTIIGGLMRKCIIDGESKKQILTDLLEEYTITNEFLLPPIPEDTKIILDKILEESKCECEF